MNIQPKRPVGRPKEAPKTVVRVRLTAELHAAWVERGGDVWLKRVLREKHNQAN